MRRRERISRRLGLVLGLAALGSTAVADAPADSACLIDSVDSLAPAAPTIGEQRPGPPAFALLQTGRSELEMNLKAVCVGDRLAGLTLGLMPGQTRSIILVARPDPRLPLAAAEYSSVNENGRNGAWHIVVRPAQVVDDLEPGQAQRIEMLVTAGAANRRGQRQSFWLRETGIAAEASRDASLELILESLDDERMFRDNFKVDPSVGQFSLRGDQTAPTDHRVHQDVAATAP